MSAIVKQSGAELEVLEDQTPAGASHYDQFTHLHFDRRARAWRGHGAISVDAPTGDDEQDAPELRSA
jgi:hypothetical protein